MVQRRIRARAGMGETLHVGSPKIDIAVRRRANARRFTLRVTGEGAVMTVPARASLQDAQKFADAQVGWLEDKLVKQPRFETVDYGTYLPLEGEDICIAEGKGRKTLLDNDILYVAGRSASPGPRVRAWLKMQAREVLVQHADYYAERLGKWYDRMSLRDTRSRWGSCSSSGDLMFSWRLIMAPPQVLEYVVAHEIAHLEEMNHSAAFWAIVERLYPDYARERAWLRKNGAQLQRYRFDA